MSTPLTALAHHLQAHQEQIIERWKQACEADKSLELVSKLTHRQFRNNIPAAIKQLSRVLVEGSKEADSKEAESEVAKHGHHRWKQGFSLQQLIRDWGILNQVMLEVVDGYFDTLEQPQPAARTVALRRLAVFMTSASSSSVRRFDELRRAEAASLAADISTIRDQFDTLTRARGQMLREAAHDIRNGLFAIAGASEVLKYAHNTNDSLSDLIETLDDGIGSVRQMLNSLLDLSRLESGAEPVRLVSVDIAELLAQLGSELKTLAKHRGLSLQAEGPETLLVQTDPEKVRRIAQNLLINGLQHTSSGTIRLRWQLDNNRWLLVISDTGPGIQDLIGSPVAQEMNAPDLDRGTVRLNPSFPHRGEGIGLTIVKRLCDMLDAGISLESEKGRGSTFTITFPREYLHAPPAAEEQPIEVA